MLKTTDEVRKLPLNQRTWHRDLCQFIGHDRIKEFEHDNSDFLDRNLKLLKFRFN